MTKRRMAPTRSNLMSARETLDRAREGHEILDRKREVLTSELVHIANDAVQLQSEVQKLLQAAYEALEVARLDMGREHLEWASLSVTSTIEVDVRPSSVMGVVIPRVSSTGRPPENPYGLGNTTVALDEAAARFREVVARIPELAETVTTVWRLARELQKTQRRVNALEHVFIPDYEEIVDFIETSLEEREREELFRMKRIKAAHGTDRGRDVAF
ncbi:MAG: V-type ATP synthase subunit D [Anaerolineae bacterium]|nr:V-type ATP synthase subunit D [Anaerolineae bacterium]